MKTVVTLALSLAIATAAQATIEVENVAVSPSSAGLSGSFNFNIPQFDPSLGTLNSVSLSLTATVGDVGYSVLNISGIPLPVIFAGVSSPSGSLVNAALGLDATWGSSQSLTSGSFVAGPGFTQGSLPFTFNTAASTAGVPVAGFTGAGDYVLTVTGSSTATSSGSPGFPLFYGFYGNVGGNLEVDYNYSPVPETTTLLAGALLLLPLGVSTLRVLRKNRAA